MVRLVLTVLLAAPLSAQILHPTTPLPTFEVATIKPSLGDETIPSKTSPSESLTINVSTRNLIEKAFNIPWTPAANDRVLGGPAWADTDHYDIDARLDDTALRSLSNDARKQQINLMLQALLTDRFQLKYHFESRTLPVFNLVAAKDGPRLPPTKSVTPPDDEPAPTGSPIQPKDLHSGLVVLYNGQAAIMTAKSATVDDLIHWFAGYSEIGGRPILNQTNLTARYDFTLTWARIRLTAPDGQPPPPDSDADPLFTAIEKQLGLRLQAAKAPVEVLVIDHVAHPSAN